MIDVAIFGSTGYTALELIKILLRHPQVRITAVTSRQAEAPSIYSVHPSLQDRLNLDCQNLTPAQVAEKADFVFCCLPHGVSMEAVPDLLGAGCKVVDLSADYRLSDPVVFEEWYGLVHTDPTRLGQTVYGLPEIWREKIVGEELVANPGCYTSASILALAPLLKDGLIEPQGIVIDAKSGVSGSGRSPKLTSLFGECNESVSAYAVGRHRHTPEIELILSQIGNHRVEVVFTPHLVPMDRGILCSIYAKPTREVSDDEILDAMRNFYAETPFVRIVEHLPATKDTVGTNYCDITVRQSKGTIIVFSALDNLIKGAAGVAIQNFNLMNDFDETTALII